MHKRIEQHTGHLVLYSNNDWDEFSQTWNPPDSVNKIFPLCLKKLPHLKKKPSGVLTHTVFCRKFSYTYDFAYAVQMKKVYFSMPRRHTEGEHTALLNNLISRWRWVVNFMHQLFYPCNHWRESLVCPKADLHILVNRKFSWPYQEWKNNPSALQSVA